jgi:hypothetical protein
LWLPKVQFSEQTSVLKSPPIAKLQTVVRQCKKPTLKWHIWFFPTHEPTLKKPKEPFIAKARTEKQNIKN